MKNKYFIIINIISIIIILKLVGNIILNGIVIKDYRNEKYKTTTIELLTFLNFPESYVANYNYGNIMYQNKEYKNAILKYEKVLSTYIPKDKECKVRINYALAICKTVVLDETKLESIEMQLKSMRMQ